MSSSASHAAFLGDRATTGATRIGYKSSRSTDPPGNCEKASTFLLRSSRVRRCQASLPLAFSPLSILARARRRPRQTNKSATISCARGQWRSCTTLARESDGSCSPQATGSDGRHRLWRGRAILPSIAFKGDTF